MRKTAAPKPPSFAALVQQFFIEYLVAQRALSPRTVACHRNVLMLFLDFVSRKPGKAPTAMRLADIRAELILGFLEHLEHERKNAVRSRNLRVTALRASLKFAARRDVVSLHDIERALAVPMKRFEPPIVASSPERRWWRCSASRERVKPRSAATCCWPCSTTRVRATPRSSACAWSMSSWMAVPACTCMARGASCDPYRCGALRPWKSGPGCG